MAQEGKLDLLLKTLEEHEKRRLEAEERGRTDLLELKGAVEARLPKDEKRIQDLNTLVGNLSAKVEQLESGAQHQVKLDKANVETKEEPFRSPSPTSFLHGMRDPLLNSSATFSGESAFTAAENGGGSGAVASSLPPMTCPQFSGENPQMWRANCEVYCDVYGIPTGQWVKIATLNFVGNAAFWLQSVINQLIGVTWFDLCERVCARFTRDRHEALIRQWVHIRQTRSVFE